MAKRFTLNKDLFIRWNEEDFSDDGTKFRMYKYKNVLPISQTSWHGMTFTCIRLDYLGLSYKNYKDDLRIMDEFNGVDIENADKEKFIENCEYIMNKYLA